MFHENLDLPCVFSQGFEADRCNAAAMCADRTFRTGLEPSWVIYHCALLQILHRPGEAGFTDSLVAHLNKGRPIFLASDASSWFTYERLYVQFSRINLIGRSEKMSPRVCGFVRLRQAQPTANFHC